MPASKPLRFPVLLLDYDGTLAETRPAIRRAVQEGLAAMGQKPLSSEALDRHLGQGGTLREFYKILVPGSTEQQSSDFVAAYRAAYVGADEEETYLFPEVKETLQALADQGYVMAAISNKHEPSLLEGIARFGLEKYFPISMGAVDGLPRKPDATVWTERLQPALKARGVEVDVQKCLMVGDTSADLGFAQNMAMPACWATYGHGNAEACEAFQPHYRIERFADLLKVLGT